MRERIKKNWPVIVLVLLVAVQLVFHTYCFVYERTGYHSDEIWSYGIANSSNGPHVFKSDDGTTFKNGNEWLSGDVFREYLMVSEDERFSYGNVFYNASNDMHPPLSFVILHTICSVFTDTYSEWYGYAINVLAFVIVQIALFAWSRKLFEDDAKALLVCVLYGFSLASLNTMLFVRMYGLATAFTTVSIMLHYNLFVLKDKSPLKNLVGIGIATFLGAQTIHLYLVFAFFLSAFFCLYLLVVKKFKCLFAYAGTMLLSVGVSIMVFPATLKHMFAVAGNELRQDKAPLSFDIKMGLRFVLDELFGIEINPFPSYFLIHLTEVLLVVLIIVVPLAFLCRKEKWMPAVVSKIKGILGKVPSVIKKFNWFVIMLIGAMYSYLVVVAESIEIVQTGPHVDRYFMNMYPAIYGIVVYVLVCVVNTIVGIVNKNKIVIDGLKRVVVDFAAIVVLMTIILSVVYVKHDCFYYFDYRKMAEDMLGQELEDLEEVKLSDIDDGADLVIMLKEFWLMTCLSQQVKDCDNFMATCHNWCFVEDEWMNGAVEAFESIGETGNDRYWITEVPYHSSQLGDSMGLEEHYEANIESRAVSTPDNPLVKERMDKYINNMKELDFVTNMTFVGRSYIFGRIVFVYKLN